MRFLRSEPVAFWGLVALFLVLDFCWIVIPGIYFHYHPVKPWPGADYGSPIWSTYLFWTAVLVGVGLPQLRLYRQLESKTASFLLWLFLMLALLLLIDNWIFSLAVRFWTIQGKRWSYWSELGYNTSRFVGPYVLRGTVGIGILNLGFFWLRRPRVP